MDIDWKKILKQEPEFAKYASQIALVFLTLSAPEFTKGIYSFYQMGMPTERVEQWIKLNIRLSKLDK